MKNFLTPAELQEHADSYTIIDCRGSLANSEEGFQAYQEGHIPGALFLDVHTTLSSPQEAHGGRNPLPPLNEFVAKLEALGISNSSRVLIYDDWIFGAARLWWMLKYVGIDHVYLLKGGFKAWTEAGYGIAKGLPPTSIEPAKITVVLQKSSLVNRREVMDMLGNDDYILVDSREGRRYRGEFEPLDSRAGHIPGAINIFYNDAYTSSGIKSEDELKELYKPLFNTEKTPVVYCGSGISAPISMLTMEEVGLKPILYLGSFSDWVSYDDSPVATGEEE